MKFLELKIPPVAAFMLFGAAMWLISSLVPINNFYIPFKLPVALILTFAGAVIAIAGISAFRKAQTTVNPLKPGAASKIVTSGIYRFSRNPMYTGLLFILAAWAVWLGNPLALLVLPAFVLFMNRFQIIPEERALNNKFGPEFNAYMMSVRRWL